MVGEGMKKTLVIGSNDAPYHPLSNINALNEILPEHNLVFSEDPDSLLQLNDYSLLICYLDSWEQPLTSTQAAALKEYLSTGGKILSIHNGISIQDTPSLTELTGARFTGHPLCGELQIKPIPGHPITAGVDEFRINDEPYHFELSENLNILATYDYNGITLPAAWEHKYGKGTLIYLMPGHDAAVFENGGYRKMIRNSVRYIL
jgi:type 1 glutamine amidotransferase